MYDQELKRILFDYKSYIQTTNNDVNPNNYKTIQINTFNDMDEAFVALGFPYDSQKYKPLAEHIYVGAAVSEAAECGGAVFCASLSVPLQDACVERPVVGHPEADERVAQRDVCQNQ